MVSVKKIHGQIITGKMQGPTTSALVVPLADQAHLEVGNLVQVMFLDVTCSLVKARAGEEQVVLALFGLHVGIGDVHGAPLELIIGPPVALEPRTRKKGTGQWCRAAIWAVAANGHGLMGMNTTVSRGNF